MRCNASVAIVVAAVLGVSVFGPGALAAPAPWRAPRTADGHPDLQGIWTNGTLTPFERADEHAGKAVLTESEVLALERQERLEREGEPADPHDVGSDPAPYVEGGYRFLSTRQSSLVIDPPDGRLPLRPQSEQRRDKNLASYDSYENLGQFERCITRAPTSMVPSLYNNGFQIVQTASHVIIVSEMVHDARVIVLDGRPHVDARIRDWMGDSRGHWEGPTLVVDTTNFNDKGWMATNGTTGRLLGVPRTEELHVVERFTRTSADTIEYRMTVEDPAIYSAPWTIAFPFTRDDSYRMFEYACHEGNRAIELELRGARAEERAAEAAAANK